ncbi:MAG: PocR ligand-binding domain-containing protein [Desulfonatronovibrionaceae bacterium]
MELTDVAWTEKWEELEKALHENSGLNACVYNNQGARITKYTAWGNKICPIVKGHPQGVANICAVANQNMTSRAREAGEPIVGECDAGFVKFAVPIIKDKQFLGTVGGCGHLYPQGEVETFYIHKSIGHALEELDRLAAEIPRTSPEEVQKQIRFVQGQLARILE